MMLSHFIPVLLAGVALAQPRPVTPEDYYLFENVVDARISPDAHQVAYVARLKGRSQAEPPALGYLAGATPRRPCSAAVHV